MIKILFVCTGNICRSPTAEGVFRAMVEEAGLAHLIEIDSAGLIAFHAGEEPDRRSQKVARDRGVDISSQKARQLTPDDFHRFNLILAMDQGHLSHLSQMAPEHCRDQIRLFMSFRAKSPSQEISDPYYGGKKEFEHTYDLIELGSAALLRRLREIHNW